MATRDTFLELAELHGSNESVIPVRCRLERVGGKGHLAAQAFTRTGISQGSLLAEIAQRDSAFETVFSYRHLLRTLSEDSRVWVVTDQVGDQRTLVQRGLARLSPSDLMHIVDDAIKASDAIYITAERHSLLMAVWNSISRMSHDERPRIVVNPCVPFQNTLQGDSALQKTLVGSAEIIICNSFEMRSLSSALGSYVLANARLIVCTRGASGCDYSVDGGSSWTSFRMGQRSAVPGSTAAGAGDVFNGTLLAYLSSSASVEDCIASATDAAGTYVQGLRADLDSAQSAVVE